MTAFMIISCLALLAWQYARTAPMPRALPWPESKPDSEATPRPTPWLVPSPQPKTEPHIDPIPLPDIEDVQRRRLRNDLYAFGNKLGPKGPRIKGHNVQDGNTYDIEMDAGGMVGPEPKPGQSPAGASTFGDPWIAPLTGHFHKTILSGILIPQGLGIIADGSEMGGRHSPTHHTIYPTRRMTPQMYVDSFMQIGWQYAGRKL